jgi:membrane fusion protein, heavy metal efflux system
MNQTSDSKKSVEQRDRAAVSAPPAAAAATGRPSAASRLFFALQFFGAIAVAGGVLIYLVFWPAGDPHERVDGGPQAQPPIVQAVEPLDDGMIRVDPDSSLGRKLDSTIVEVRRVTTAALRVTGTVAASLRPVGPDNSEQWQFNDPEALAAYFEWRRAGIDVQFAEQQVRRMKQLNEVRVTSRKTIVERLQRLVAAGTDSLADLQLAEAELLESEIEGSREIHEAESELSLAQQEKAVAKRQLQLMGLDVEMLQQATSDVDIVVAEVPEGHQARVRIGQQCEALFFGIPRQIFPGTVQRIAPTLSLERRALRVLFFVDDPDDQLRPGMFADIGLGTDARDAILVPATSVIHIGRDSYVFVRAGDEPDVWMLARVQAADVQNGEVEILEGLDPGQEIISQNAILLKPVAAAGLREAYRGML